MPGPPELLILLAVVLLLFGGAKLPKLARSLGEAKSEFEKATDSGVTPPDVGSPSDHRLPASDPGAQTAPGEIAPRP